MKKLILCLTVSALALVTSLQAATDPAAAKASASNPKDKDKAACTDKAMAGSCTASCCKAKAAKPVLMSPKAAVLAGK